MENTIDFDVKENSLQEFAEKYMINAERSQDMGRQKESINPYYLLGRDNIYVRKEIMDVISGDPTVKFTISDESRNMRHRLVNTYQYLIEKYDDVSLVLTLIDFKVEVVR